MLLELTGWLGTALLALQGVPQAFACIKQGHSDGLHRKFLWMWFWGEVLTIPLVIHTGSIPLLMNYLVNLIVVLIILKYSYFPRHK